MPTMNENVTLVCLFHNAEVAETAVQDLLAQGIPQAEIFQIGSNLGTAAEGSEIGAEISRFHLPEKDIDMLTDGLDNGGTLVAVETSAERSDLVQEIFERHQATQVDEKSRDGWAAGLPVGGHTVANDQVIPIAEEELVVGKRQVEIGRTRVFTRVTETPVEETLNLREETATVQRRSVNRAVTNADADAFRAQSVEITETDEVPVVAKTARVVEEVLVGTESTERTERISDSVRKTEVDVEKIGNKSRV